MPWSMLRRCGAGKFASASGRSLQILPLLLERQDYAFALPDYSPVREAIDASLLQAIHSADWQSRVAEYRGEGE